MKKINIFLLLLIVILLSHFVIQNTGRTQTFETFASGLNSPSCMAFDSLGNLYVSNQNNGIINKITPDGTVTTFPFPGLFTPEGLLVYKGYIYVSDFTHDAVKRMPLTGGTIVTYTGAINGPYGLAINTNTGDLYVANFIGNSISKITPSGVVTTFVTGLIMPLCLKFDNTGYLYVSIRGTNSISKISSGGVIIPFATGFDQPQGISFDNQWNLYVCNYANGMGTTISKVTAVGFVSTYANGFSVPIDVALNTSGFMYITNIGNGSVSRSVDPTGIVHNGEIVQNFKLHQNYPNPFNPTTNVQFSIPNVQLVTLKIYDILGNEISTLVNEQLKPGMYEVEFDGSNYSSGVYYYRIAIHSDKLLTDEYTETKRMVLLK